MPTKQCTRCRQEKDYEDFGKRNHAPDGRQYYCKSCAEESWQKSKTRHIQPEKDNIFFNVDLYHRSTQTL